MRMFSKAELCENPIKVRPVWQPDGKWFRQRVKKTDFMIVPCGKCLFCRYKQSREWSHRIQLEMEYYGGTQNCAFVTLTYNDENLPKAGVIKKHVQDYVKRVRSRLGRNISFYAVGEYGELLKRPHYHLIVIGARGRDRYQQMSRLKAKLPLLKTGDDWYHLHKAWQDKGFTDIQEPRSSGGVSGYVGSYLCKLDKAREDAEKYGWNAPFKLMSKGLGKERILQIAKKWKKNELVQWPIYYFERSGFDKKKNRMTSFKMPLGRYLRNILHKYCGKMEELKQYAEMFKIKMVIEYGKYWFENVDEGLNVLLGLKEHRMCVHNNLRYRMNYS